MHSQIVQSTQRHPAMQPQSHEQRWTSIKGLFQTLKGTKAFLTLLFDESGSLDAVEELSTSLVDSHAFQLAVENMKTVPEVAEIIAERYMAPPTI
jgi:ubiquinone biosynthesis protein Coq4